MSGKCRYETLGFGLTSMMPSLNSKIQMFIGLEKMGDLKQLSNLV